MHAPTPSYRHYPSAADAAPMIAAEGVEVLRRAIAAHGSAGLALTGGSAPGPVYDAWVRDSAEAIDWSRVHVFLGDERNVPPDHADSNMQTCKALLDGLPLDRDRLHPWRTDQQPKDALEHMRQVLAKAGLTERGLDLTLLGVGPDGHIASLFPAHQPWRTLAEDRPDPVAFIADSPKPPAERYTFTLPFINQSAVVYLLPFGSSKREAVDGFRQNDDALPVRYVRGREQTVVWTDLDLQD